MIFSAVKTNYTVFSSFMGKLIFKTFRHFRMKRTAQLGRLVNAYAQRVGIEPDYYRFLFDGHRIGNEQTPEMLEMEDDAAIEVYRDQEGGGSFCH
jgi:hypothetical protein